MKISTSPRPPPPAVSKGASAGKPVPNFPGWTQYPTVDVPALAVELVGKEATGKTHVSGSFPYPALCDTENKGWRVWKKLGQSKYFQAESWEDVLSFYYHIMENTVTSQDQQGHVIDPAMTVDTVVFDSSRDLRDWAELFTLNILGKKSLFSKQEGAQKVQYALVYQKLDDLIQSLRKSGRNVIFTARMKEEYVGDTRTGRMIRDGYNKAPYQFDVIVYLKKGVLNSKGQQLYKKRIFGEVHKVGTMHMSKWPPYLVDVSYKGIITELVNGEGTDLSRDEFIDAVIRPQMEAEHISP